MPKRAARSSTWPATWCADSALPVKCVPLHPSRALRRGAQSVARPTCRDSGLQLYVNVLVYPPVWRSAITPPMQNPAIAVVTFASRARSQ